MENNLVAVSRAFASEDPKRSWFHVAETFFVLALVMAGAALAPYWPLRAVASIVAGLTIVRAFILAHDFHHGAILRKNPIADAIFFVYGLLVLTPPRIWRDSHNYHHANTAKIVGAQIGSFPVMTVEMWKRAPKSKRMMYAAARHPITIAFGYVTIFLLGMCFGSFVKKPKQYWDSGLAIALHAVILGVVTYFFGFQMTLFTVILPLMVACAAGSYLFYAQHNFPGIDIQPRQTWSFQKAAMESSSYMKTGPIMSWFTGHIGLHHIHHLNAVIPFYRLHEAMAAVPEFQVKPQTSLSPSDIAACLRLKLWDPVAKEMVPYPKDAPAPEAS
ncbi:MAG: fatty acid desaturase [Polyangiaceae bacterium]|nr:fatty acid desaturase [Polyangiaceae bacterium]